jgi:5'(3')-deoxyribonucleotidase
MQPTHVSRSDFDVFVKRLAGWPLRKLRQCQSAVEAQLKAAYREMRLTKDLGRRKDLERAMDDLTARHDTYTAAVAVQSWPKEATDWCRTYWPGRKRTA